PIYLRCPENWRGKIRSDRVRKLFNEFLRGRMGSLGGDPGWGKFEVVGSRSPPGVERRSPAIESFGCESAAAANCFRSGSRARGSEHTQSPRGAVPRQNGSS